MDNKESGTDMVNDFITGKPVPLVGAEENRQAVERFLVEEKGYARADIAVDEKITVKVGDEDYESFIDLVVYVDRRRFMAFKCAPGSLGSREREILAAARVIQAEPVPFAVVSDGKTAIVMETGSGKKLGEELSVIFSKQAARTQIDAVKTAALPEARIKKEAILFRSYDSMNVNRKRPS